MQIFICCVFCYVDLFIILKCRYMHFQFHEAFQKLRRKFLCLSHFCFIVPGIIGCLQALEAIKIASAIGEPLSGRMLLLDALSGRIRIVCFFSRILEFS